MPRVYFELLLEPPRDEAGRAGVLSRLAATLRSIFPNDDPAWQALIVGSEEPDLPELADRRVAFLEVPPETPDDPAADGTYSQRQRQVSREFIRGNGGGYVVTPRLGDLVSRKLVGFIRRKAAPHGYHLRTAYVFSVEAGHLAMAETVWKEEFDRVCEAAVIEYVWPAGARPDHPDDSHGAGAGQDGTAAERTLTEIDWPAVMLVLRTPPAGTVRGEEEERIAAAIEAESVAVTPDIGAEFSLLGALVARYERRRPAPDEQKAAEAQQALQAKAARALDFARESGVPPMLLVFHPDYSRANPYQTLLYRRFAASGIGVIPLDQPADKVSLNELGGPGVPVILHLHWTNWVLKDARTEEEAEKRVDEFGPWLAELRASGIRIVWTVHNILPHEYRYREPEIRLQQCIADHADVIHVMHPSTPSALQGITGLDPERVVVVPHPNYIGSYADSCSKAQARLILGIDRDEVVYALVGRLKAYKGVDKVIPALDRLGTDRPRRLVVAGNPDESEECRAFIEQCARHPRVLLHRQGTVPSDEVQIYLRAADIVLAPYGHTLNSGYVLLALSFGRPVVAPASGSLAAILKRPCAELYDPDDPEGFAKALARADRLVNPRAALAAKRLAKRFDSVSLSQALADALRERLLDGGDDPPASPALPEWSGGS